MPLISGVVNTVIPPASGNGNAGATNAGQTTEPKKDVAPVAETSGSAAGQDASGAGNTTTGTSYTRQAQAAADVAAQAGEPQRREDDKVVAVDFARRAAIAVQARAKAESLLEDLSEEPFAPLTRQVSDSAASYAKTEGYGARLYDKVETSA